MGGVEFIKVYDNLLSSDQGEMLSSIASTQPPGKINDGMLDERLFQLIRGFVLEYRKEFDHLTSNHTIDLGDEGYTLGKASQLGSLGSVGANSKDTMKRVATMLVFVDESSMVRFPIQGMTISSTLGRVIIFPSGWTHPFHLSGEGDVIQTHLIY